MKCKIIESRGDANIWIVHQILGFLLIFFIIYLKLRFLFRAKTNDVSLILLCSRRLQIVLFIVSWMNIHLWLTYVILWAKISTRNFNVEDHMCLHEESKCINADRNSMCMFSAWTNFSNIENQKLVFLKITKSRR